MMAMASNKVGRTVLTMAVVAVISGTWLPARAETDITGSPDALRVEAHDTALQAVLTALGVRIRTSADLNRPVDGTFKGSLREVIARLLDGYDFFIHKSGDDIEVVVVGSSGAAAVAAVPAPVPTAPVVAKRSASEPFDRRGF
jgi:hypothetical protein